MHSMKKKGNMKAFVSEDPIFELSKFNSTFEYKSIVETMDNVLRVLKKSRPDFHLKVEYIRKKYENIIIKKKDLVFKTVFSTGYSCILILLAIFVLPFSNMFEGCFSWLVIALFIILTSFDFYKIFLIIKNSLIE